MREDSNRGLNEMEKKCIEAKSMELLNNLGYALGEVDVIEIAKNLGFQVGIAPLIEEEDGFIIVDNSRESIQKLTGLTVDKIIGINSQRDLETKRFIIAHEIGHYCLHYNENNDNGMYAHRENKKGKDEQENDVDFFAACLLMPCKQFREKYEELREKQLNESDIILLLQKHFNVPAESAKRRIKEIAEV